MTMQLEMWLKRATRHLSRDASAQVRREINEHYDATLENLVAGGTSFDEANRVALEALGDAKTANRDYRKVLLTSGEARMLQQENRTASAVCSRLWVMPVVAWVAAIALYFAGSMAMARILLLGGMALGVIVFATFLPVYTPARSRVYRAVKWVMLGMILLVAFAPLKSASSATLFSCAWPIIWIEWTRASLRRKLPVAQWPKQLYL